MKKAYINNTPIYVSISESILTDAAKAGLRPGDRLPGIRKMTRKYRVSETPVRQALAKLKDEKKIEVVHGSGSYLKEPESRDVEDSVIADRENDLFAATSHLPFAVKKCARLTIHLIDAYPRQRRMWQGILDRFEDRNPSIKLECVFNSAIGNMTDFNGDLPDVFQVSSYSLFDRRLRERLLPLSIPCWENGEFVTPVVPDFFDVGNFGGSQYGLPLCVTLPTLLVNRDIFRQLGGNTETLPDLGWRDLINCMKKLREKKEDGVVSQHVLGLASMLPPFYLMNAMSNRIFTESRGYDWKCQDVKTFFRQLQLIASQSDGGLSFTTQGGIGNMVNLFRNGRLLALGMATVFLEYFAGQIPEFAEIIPFPCSPQGKLLGAANYHVVHRNSVHGRDCQRFIEFLFTDEIRKWVLENDFYHVLGRRAGDAANSRKLMIEEAGLGKIFPLKVFGQGNEDFVSDVFNPVFDQICQGEMQVGTAVDLLREKYQQGATYEH